MKEIKLIDILKDIVRNPFTGELLEGLIRTVPVDQAVKVIKKEIKNYPGAQINSEGDVIEVGFKPTYLSNMERNYINVNLPDFRLMDLLALTNNLGYSPSIIKYRLGSNPEQHSQVYTSKFLRDLILKEEPSYILFTLEAKYDPIVDVPKYVYHITSQKFINSIKKVGLKPKSLQKRSQHPERVYVAFSEEDLELLLKTLKYHFAKNQGVKLTINTDRLKGPFYKDPNFAGHGAYTYQNIPLEAIVEYIPIQES
jgi:uncharacterized protein (DUF736 family)